MQTYIRNYPQNDRRQLHPAKRVRGAGSKRLLITGSLIIVALAAKNVLAASNGSNPRTIKAAGTSEIKKEKQPDPPKPKKIVDTSNLAASIGQINAQYPYNTSVAVIELNSGKLIQTGDSYPYVAASTTKLLTALYFFNKVETGEESLEKNIAGKPAREQMRLMVNQSDNMAWGEMNAYLSKPGLQEFAQKQGLTSYDSVKNTITSSDMAILMAKIYKRQLMNDVHTTLLFSWMQKTSEERFIPPAVPGGVQLYHKAGYLNDRAHDVAIIDNGSTPFVLVIYSKSYTNSYDYLKGRILFKQITTGVLNTFSQ